MQVDLGERQTARGVVPEIADDPVELRELSECGLEILRDELSVCGDGGERRAELVHGGRDRVLALLKLALQTVRHAAQIAALVKERVALADPREHAAAHVAERVERPKVIAAERRLGDEDESEAAADRRDRDIAGRSLLRRDQAAGEVRRPCLTHRRNELRTERRAGDDRAIAAAQHRRDAAQCLGAHDDVREDAARLGLGCERTDRLRDPREQRDRPALRLLFVERCHRRARDLSEVADERLGALIRLDQPSGEGRALVDRSLDPVAGG